MNNSEDTLVLTVHTDQCFINMEKDPEMAHLVRELGRIQP